jgi:CRP-like cAMP-binding protein
LEKEKKELEIVLLDASQRYKIFQQEFPTLEQLIPQYHIASYLGISATQLSRIRHQMALK